MLEGRNPRNVALTPSQQLQADVGVTTRLMHEGADVIYQAALFDGTWRGYADFLLRRDGPSRLGDYHYEVADTKLARHTKGSALLQMCVYSDLVATIQGVMPAEMHVALGGSGHHVDTHRVDDYAAYYRGVRQRFLEAVRPDRPLAYPLPVIPEPVAHCDVCRWQPMCAGLRRDGDHLSLVASMRSDQARRLRDAGIPTLSDLGRLQEPLPHVDKLGDAAMSALHQQARLQLEARTTERPPYEFLPLEPNRGLAWLPEPSPGDLFFDMEGDPFAEEDGLEYLFGVWDPSEPDADMASHVPHVVGSHAGRGEDGIRGVYRLRDDPMAGGPGHARLSLRGIRARPDGDAVDPPRHARGASRPHHARRAARRPVQGRAPGPRSRRRMVESPPPNFPIGVRAAETR